MEDDYVDLSDYNDDSVLENEIADLERRLAEAKAKRRQLTPQSDSPPSHTPSSKCNSPMNRSSHQLTCLNSPTHFLLLLSDSALPLGSFAFSSGLESYLAHHQKTLAPQQPASFTSFLPLSISSYASTTLPYVLAAHRDPSLANLAALDDMLDASIICTVGRRASVAQGRALLSIWERSFVGSPGTGTGAGGETDGEREGEGVRGFSALLRCSAASSSPSSSGDGGGAWDVDPPAVAAHLPPLFGAICALVGLDLEQTAYVFLLGHVKALVSAAVRAGVFGPYQAQRTLASGSVQGLIRVMIEREWETRVEDAGQNVPVMDLWAGRHEVLYSRIFNS
ncbi:UreF-domain-containing protein [Chaetomium strumarium]|uniref:UreF-domain-containing protein n=1 Tax=Chaetomium strumarium TaxID=1170767 RepID=A0AAJ0M4K7_9PEZI|nr:UreF-domain-containing protein [Chaetomium strumarium]